MGKTGAVYYALLKTADRRGKAAPDSYLGTGFLRANDALAITYAREGQRGGSMRIKCRLAACGSNLRRTTTSTVRVASWVFWDCIQFGPSIRATVLNSSKYLRPTKPAPPHSNGFITT